MSERKTRALEAMLRIRVLAPASANLAKQIIQKAMTLPQVKTTPRATASSIARINPPYRRRGNDRTP